MWDFSPSPPHPFPQFLPCVGLLHLGHGVVAGDGQRVDPAPMLFRAFLRVLTPELPKQPNRGRYVCPSRPSAASWFRWEQGREELTGTFSVDRIGGEQGAMLAGQL